MGIETLVPIFTEIKDTNLLGMYFEHAPNGEEEEAEVRNAISSIDSLTPNTFFPGKPNGTYGAYLSIQCDGDVREADQALRDRFSHRAINLARVRGEVYRDINETPVCENIIFKIGERYQPGELPTEDLIEAVRAIEGVRAVRLGLEGVTMAIGGTPPENILRVATQFLPDITAQNGKEQLITTAVQAADRSRLFLPTPATRMEIKQHKQAFLMG